jgi:hypothetical protein
LSAQVIEYKPIQLSNKEASMLSKEMQNQVILEEPNITALSDCLESEGTITIEQIEINRNDEVTILMNSYKLQIIELNKEKQFLIENELDYSEIERKIEKLTALIAGLSK